MEGVCGGVSAAATLHVPLVALVGEGATAADDLLNYDTPPCCVQMNHSLLLTCSSLIAPLHANYPNSVWLHPPFSSESRAEVKSSNRAAVWFHPDNGCPNDNIGKDLCRPNYAYLHFVCLTGRVCD